MKYIEIHINIKYLNIHKYEIADGPFYDVIEYLPC